jgi:DNA mismatch repair protein MutS
MMRQYKEIKERYKDCILFFRLGDFYEMFFDDAVTASRELEITLTGRSGGEEGRAPMCGVPYHSSESYLARLVEKGHKVAICEQMEDPAEAKGLVRRQVTRVVTPGTVTGEAMLKEGENNYLASLYLGQSATGLAYCDVSTGELRGCEIRERLEESVINELARVKARELLLNPYAAEIGFPDEIEKNLDIHLSPLPEGVYRAATAESRIFSQFDVISLKGLGLEEKEGLTLALAALIHYLDETQKQSLKHVRRPEVYELGGSMALDKATIRNLELTETLYSPKPQGSLLGTLDRTSTAMGGRKLRRWLREPLNRPKDINRRLDAVDFFFEDILLRNNVREHLKGVYDIERLSARISCGNANCKDLLALRNSISRLPEIKTELKGADGLVGELRDGIADLSEAERLIDSAISEDAPFTLREGGMIKPGYSERLDAMKQAISEGQRWIAALEGLERQRTGIKNLKVGYNRVFGYYIEVSKSYYSLVPYEYIRKQTLANCERFITPELKEVEAEVLGAEAKINQLEFDLFQELRARLAEHTGALQDASEAIGSLDVLAAFAESAAKLGYVKPTVDDGTAIHIEKGRHPVIERAAGGGAFVPNDLWMDGKDRSMLLITGPNMAGKSTYMRQTALITLMAQAGSFVPAEKASIGAVDRIFTRIGASDNLSQGQSTFYVEMSELAYILNTATEKSLVILDEIGRGTSTYDGLAIAWAVTEHLCGRGKRVRTLFATHYHELTALEGQAAGLANLNVDVSDAGGDVVFLHKIVEGSASRSYGIHVARLAGVPEAVLERAEDKLEEMEGKAGAEGPGRAAMAVGAIGFPEMGAARAPFEQISFFSFVPNPTLERLKALNLMEITPSQAFSILEELKEAAENER